MLKEDTKGKRIKGQGEGFPKIIFKETESKGKPIYYYEFEIFMAKKRMNLVEVYKNLEDLLKVHDSQIDGFSIYDVEGGWRDEIPINSEDDKIDWDQLWAIYEKHRDRSESPFKDLIRPLYKLGGKRFAVFDERSIILKIIIKSEDRIISGDAQNNPALGEILKVFEKVSQKEQSIFITLTELWRIGQIADTAERSNE